MPRANVYMFLAAVSGLLAVGLGAFGAHGLKGHLSPELLAAYQTGVQYQFIHTLAVFAVAVWMAKGVACQRTVQWAVNCFLAGIVLFSGSLYAIALMSLGDGFPSWLGPVTPVGGLSFMIGWGLLALAAVKHE